MGSGCESTPKEVLEKHIMDINIPKSETEWWAYHEISKLRDQIYYYEHTIKQYDKHINRKLK